MKNTTVKYVYICFSALFLLGIMSLIFIANYTIDRHEYSDKKLIVIFGAGYLENGHPVLALEKRLVKGVELWQKYENHQYDAHIMVSGRKKEAIIMRDFLINQGIDETKILLDSYGHNTRTTVKNAFINADKMSITPIFISQGYHIPRIKFYTTMYGYKKGQYMTADRVSISFIDMLKVASRELLAISAFPLVILVDYID